MIETPPSWQFALAAYIPLVTANLSVMGSSLIAYSILGPGRSTKLRKPQHRILCAMSLYDIIYSTAKAWTFLLAPKGYGVPGAQGNLTTCALQGFCIELAHATGAYNAILGVYYYLTICRNVKRETFSRWIEPILHVLVFCIFIGFAIAGVVIQLFNPVYGFCFIGSYPPGCESSPEAPTCDRFPPSQLGIYYEVFAQMWIQLYFIVVVLTNGAIWWKVRTTERATRKYQHGSSGKQSRERAVAIQSSSYVVAFAACWIGPTIFHLANWIGGYKAFWAVLVIVIFTPLQGFWNVFIYARPTYVRLRCKYPNMTRRQVLTTIFFTVDSCNTVTVCGKSAVEEGIQESRVCQNKPTFRHDSTMQSTDHPAEGSFGEDDDSDEHTENGYTRGRLETPNGQIEPSMRESLAPA